MSRKIRIDYSRSRRTLGIGHRFPHDSNNGNPGSEGKYFSLIFWSILREVSESG